MSEQKVSTCKIVNLYLSQQLASLSFIAQKSYCKIVNL